MSTETAVNTDVTSKPKAIVVAARYVLTVERILMGLFFVGFAVSGFLSLVPSSDAGSSFAFGGMLAKAGYLFPLLKGTEVLLEQLVAAAYRKA